LITLWFTIAIVVGGFLLFRHIANQPCTSPLACFAPMFYVALKPILMLGGAALIGVGLIATLLWMVRRAER
jgi:hypothetical protein